MGHLVNPVGTHVGVSYSWRYKCILYRNCDFKYFVDFQHFFSNFYTVLFNFPSFKDCGILYLFNKILMVRGALNLFVYLQDSDLSVPIYRFWYHFAKSIAKYLVTRRNVVKYYYSVEKKKRITYFAEKIEPKVLTAEELKLFFKFTYSKFEDRIYFFFNKTFFWFFIKKIMLGFITRFFPNFTKSRSSFFVFILSTLPNHRIFFNASLIARYFIRKFEQGHMIRNLVRPVIRFLEKQGPFVKGFKFSFSGRFSRAERATYQWMKQGAVSLNKFTDLVDYDSDFTTLKFGCVCVKVWLNYDKVYASKRLDKKDLSLSVF